MKLTDDNRQVYAGLEFDRWTHRTELEPGERFLVERYLGKDRRTFEAGCGGGRLLLDLQSRGFTDLHGFDYLPEFIEVARSRDVQQSITFSAQNAISLDYEAESFDQAIYLQQILCFLESEDDRRRAINEAYRVLRPGATMIASFLAFRARANSWVYRASMAYLSCLRRLSARQISAQYWPWLRRGNAFHLGAMLDQGPYTYWMHEREATSLFSDAGFNVIAIGSGAQIKQGQLLDSVEELEQAPFQGGLYLVCQKPAAIAA